MFIVYKLTASKRKGMLAESMNRARYRTPSAACWRRARMEEGIHPRSPSPVAIIWFSASPSAQGRSGPSTLSALPANSAGPALPCPTGVILAAAGATLRRTPSLAAPGLFNFLEFLKNSSDPGADFRDFLTDNPSAFSFADAFLMDN
jgi:hypothetical protein